MRASTGLSAQPDVWGSAFAVAVGAVEEDVAITIGRALLAGLKAGTLAWRGQIRHVLATDDHSSTTAWEKTAVPTPLNTYQNGAYWGTPTGWVCRAIAKVDQDAAKRLAREYVDSLREDDFRQGDRHGGPWECLHPNGHRQNPVYLTSVTCPLAEAMRILV